MSSALSPIYAACLEHPELNWFPVRGQSTGPAKAVCARCPVRADCLRYALDNGLDHGVFGGTTADERRRLVRTAPRHAA